MNLINIPFSSYVFSENYIAKYRHFHSVLCINLMFVHKLYKLATSMDLSICNIWIYGTERVYRFLFRVRKNYYQNNNCLHLAAIFLNLSLKTAMYKMLNKFMFT